MPKLLKKKLKLEKKREEQEKKNQAIRDEIRLNNASIIKIIEYIQTNKRPATFKGVHFLINRLMASVKYNQELYDFFIFFAKQNLKIFEYENYIHGLFNAFVLRKDSVRDYTTWKRPTHNLERQFGSILRHMFAKYYVPSFLDKSFLSGDIIGIEIFRWIGNGNNVRKFSDLTMPMTKAQAHVFLKAPKELSLSDAMKWSRIKSLGSNYRMTIELMRANIEESNLLRHLPFWDSVFRFFIEHQNEMFDTSRISVMIDYLYNQKFITERTLVGGEYKYIIPSPNLTMKGRTLTSILTQTEEWHKRLNFVKSSDNFNSWKGLPIDNFIYPTGINEQRRTYFIEQLLTAKAVQQEGKDMKHCVASYTRSCAKGQIAIFSLYYLNYIEFKYKLLTIEVRDRTIGQIKGLKNRPATAMEMNLINQWAKKEGLIKSIWL